MKFVLKKTWWIILIVIIIVGGFWYFFKVKNTPTFEYTTQTVVKGKLLQTVEATGSVKPADDLDLNFPTNGTVTEVKVEVGQQVKAGDLLIQLDNRDAISQKSQAIANLQRGQAELNKILAGASNQDIAVSEQSLKSAETDYQNSLANLEAVTKQTTEDLVAKEEAIQKAQNDLATAEQSLKDTELTENQTLNNLYSSAITTMTASLAEADIAMDEGNKILQDSNIENHLGKKDPQAVNDQKASRDVATIAISKARTDLNKAILKQTNNDIDQALQSTITALQASFTNMVDMYAVLAGTTTSLTYPVSSLDAYKATISARQSAISNSINNIQGLQQNILSAQIAENTRLNTSESAVLTAKNAIAIAEANLQYAKASQQTQITAAQNQVNTAKSGRDIAQAQLELKQAPARSVDIAAYQAQVNQLAAALEMTQKAIDDTSLKAPIDGIITEINLAKGEQTVLVNATKPAIKMISVNGFEIEVDISEADIAKIQPGNKVDITFDAFGDEQVFEGTVTSIEPDKTVIQEVIYYTVKVNFDKKEELVKPGMTANITIHTAERDNVLSIPRRAIIEKDGYKIVQILKDNEAVEVEVETGLRGDDGMIEITFGLQNGQEVITFTKELK